MIYVCLAQVLLCGWIVWRLTETKPENPVEPDLDSDFLGFVQLNPEQLIPSLESQEEPDDVGRGGYL